MNLGSISGGSSYAVDFGGGFNSANLLQVGAGATFTGDVNGDGGAVELLSGSGAIGGIGNSGQFYGFQSLNVDAGANWALNGSANSIANVTDSGILTVDGSLDVTTAVNAGSIGAFDLGAGGALELASATGSQTAVDFLGASQLTIDNAALFGTGVGGTSYLGSQLENFGAAELDRHSQLLGSGSNVRLRSDERAASDRERQRAGDPRLPAIHVGGRIVPTRRRRLRQRTVDHRRRHAGAVGADAFGRRDRQRLCQRGERHGGPDASAGLPRRAARSTCTSTARRRLRSPPRPTAPETGA